MEKYYLGTIDERSCGMEFPGRFVFKTHSDPVAHMKHVAANWRAGAEPDADGGHWSGPAYITPGDHEEIPEDDFKVLSKYLATL